MAFRWSRWRARWWRYPGYPVSGSSGGLGTPADWPGWWCLPLGLPGSSCYLSAIAGRWHTRPSRFLSASLCTFTNQQIAPDSLCTFTYQWIAVWVFVYMLTSISSSLIHCAPAKINKHQSFHYTFTNQLMDFAKAVTDQLASNLQIDFWKIDSFVSSLKRVLLGRNGHWKHVSLCQSQNVKILAVLLKQTLRTETCSASLPTDLWLSTTKPLCNQDYCQGYATWRWDTTTQGTKKMHMCYLNNEEQAIERETDWFS